MPFFTTIIHSSGPSAVDVCEDVYEIQAKTPDEAISEARSRFRDEVLTHWPDLSIEDVFVLPADADCNEFDLCDAIR